MIPDLNWYDDNKEYYKQLYAKNRDSEEPGLWGLSGIGCKECIVFTRESGAEKAIFSGKNYISLKTCRVFLVTQKWRIAE